jgi:PKD repeat protein
VVAGDNVVADLSATPTSGRAPLNVLFTIQSSGDYSSCSWSFGDGESSSVCSDLNHVYNAAGTYTVSLTVSGSGGSDNKTRIDYIVVSDADTKYLSLLPMIIGR